MMGAIDSVMENADYFTLMLFRVGALVVTSPIFGRVNIPARAKVGLVIALSYLFLTMYPNSQPFVYTTLSGFLLVVLGEFLLGITLAFITNIFFTLIFTAGQMIDMQIGFGIVNVYDIQNNTQIPMMGNVLNLMMLIVFFAVDGHLRLIEMLTMTVERMPVGSLGFSPGIGIATAELFTKSFMLGIMVALPIVASGMTLEIAFGVIMRMVPQIHMFVVGIPLKMIVGLFVFSISLPVFVGFTNTIFTEMFVGMERVFELFRAN